jgi:hypothetical protein
MGRREICHTFSLLVEIEGHFTHEFVSYVYEIEDRSLIHISSITTTRGLFSKSKQKSLKMSASRHAPSTTVLD